MSGHGKFGLDDIFDFNFGGANGATTYSIYVCLYGVFVCVGLCDFVCVKFALKSQYLGHRLGMLSGTIQNSC